MVLNPINQQIIGLFDKYTDLAKIRRKIHKIKKKTNNLDKENKRLLRQIRKSIKNGDSFNDVRKLIAPEVEQEQEQEKKEKYPIEPEVKSEFNNLLCRICYDDDNTDKDNQLCYPCKCDGSIKWIHQECLKQSIEISKSNKCAICKYEYKKSKESYSNRFVQFISDHLSKVVKCLSIICAFTIWLFVYWSINKIAHQTRRGFAKTFFTTIQLSGLLVVVIIYVLHYTKIINIEDIPLDNMLISTHRYELISIFYKIIEYILRKKISKYEVEPRYANYQR